MHDTIKAFYYLMTYPPPKLCQNTYQHNIMSMSVNDKSFGLYYLSIYLVIFYDLLDEYTFTQVHVCTPRLLQRLAVKTLDDIAVETVDHFAANTLDNLTEN